MNWQAILKSLYGAVLAGASLALLNRPDAAPITFAVLTGAIVLGALLIFYNRPSTPGPAPPAVPAEFNQPPIVPPAPVLRAPAAPPTPGTPGTRPATIPAAPTAPMAPTENIVMTPTTPASPPPATGAEGVTSVILPGVGQAPAPPQTMTLEEFEKWARENDPQLLEFLQMTQPPQRPPSGPRQREGQREGRREDQMPPAPQTTPDPMPAPVSSETGSSLTPAEAQQMLDSHNLRRARFGNGPLTWDPEIARSAQAWSEQQAAMGQMRHSSGSPYGENLSWSSGMNQTPEDILVGWSDEEEPFYDYESNSCKGGVCGHFTQVVDRRSTRLGCGRVKKGRETYWTCQYSPAGNMRGERPYVK